MRRAPSTTDGWATWLDHHSVPEHAAGLLFPPGWSSSLVDKLDLSWVLWVSTIPPLSHMHMQTANAQCSSWRHLMCPLSNGGQAVSGTQAAGWAGWQAGRLVKKKYKGRCACRVWVCVA